uniref:Uncharacterized protein n=1 Tax=Micrurus lemniscatus lemniscatus TaxID=129467 RepID=A0A2D4HM51_MICLE
MHNHLDVVSHSSKFSGISGCSDAVSHGSASSTKSSDLIIGELFFTKVASDASCCLAVGCFHQKSQLCTLLLNTGIINMIIDHPGIINFPIFAQFLLLSFPNIYLFIY